MKFTVILLLLTATVNASSFAKSWTFAVSGDSRNCGDVVMPAIAQSVLKNNVQFYWHLGDFRWFTSIDQDLEHDALAKNAIQLDEYRKIIMWRDFIENQVKPFGLTPVFLTIGNHEIQPGKTRKDYVETFRSWLDAPPIHVTNLNDEKPMNSIRPYYHWRSSHIDFISLDNATHDQFDDEQMAWFRKIIEHDENDAAVKTVVVGMHAALPDSISRSQSMSETGTGVGIESGREVYQKLLHFQNVAKKNVYILASHSHFLMEGTYNTAYWREHGGVLPGWIIGTAGALRYALPKQSGDAIQAKTRVYGYLLATVEDGGAIKFKFQLLEKKSIPPEIVKRYGSDFVTECFDKNAIDKMPGEDEAGKAALPLTSPAISPARSANP